MTTGVITPKRLPTMRDVARVAGVSQTTVSFVINDQHGENIPDATRQRVWNAVAELGYRPNQTARQLRTRRSRTIGFVTNGLIDTPFLGDLILGAQDAAWEREHLLTIATTDGDPSSEQAALETLLARGVDGVIFATLSARVVSPPPALRNLPAVLLNCVDVDLAYPSVMRDEYTDGREAAELLLRKGHRRIGLIDVNGVRLPPSQGLKRDHLEGYRQALAAVYARFDPALIHHGDGSAESGFQTARTMLQSPQPPTAFICGNDEIALGVYDAIRERRRLIPREVAVLAFTGQGSLAASLRPALSTMALPIGEMGRCAARFLTDHLALGLPLAAEQQLLPSTVIERGST